MWMAPTPDDAVSGDMPRIARKVVIEGDKISARHLSTILFIRDDKGSPLHRRTAPSYPATPRRLRGARRCRENRSITATVAHSWTNELRMALVRSWCHDCLFCALAALQSTYPLSRICQVALSIRRWRQILPSAGSSRIEPVCRSDLASCGAASAWCRKNADGSNPKAGISLRKWIKSQAKPRTTQAT